MINYFPAILKLLVRPNLLVYIQLILTIKRIGSDNIKGEVKINGEAYTAICDCSGL